MNIESETSTATPATSSETTRYRGKVVNFYEKFGFVEVTTPGDLQGTHIYINIDHINTATDDESKQAFLITGEYVEFSVDKSEDGRQHCTALGGIDGGELMCENKYMYGSLQQYRSRLRRSRANNQNTKKGNETSN